MKEHQGMFVSYNCSLPLSKASVCHLLPLSHSHPVPGQPSPMDVHLVPRRKKQESVFGIIQLITRPSEGKSVTMATGYFTYSQKHQG